MLERLRNWLRRRKERREIAVEIMRLNDAQFTEFLRTLDNPNSPSEKLAQLMGSKSPWEK